MDKLHAMQLFVRVAETGSFAAVADQLDVSRSVVTRQISALEKQLGTKLMTRSTRSLTLTTAGSDYLEKCRAILNMVDAAESSLLEEKTEPRGRIRLGLPLSFGLQRLMPALLKFAQRHAHIELVLDFSDQRSKLIEEGIDLTIRITNRLEPGDIVRKMGEAHLLTLASPTYLAQQGHPAHPRDLAHHACLVYSQDFQSTTWVYHRAGGVTQVDVRPRLAANNGDALLQAAALTYLSDLTMVSTALGPHVVIGQPHDLRVASIDHAMWFHRDMRADEWLLFALDTPVARGGHGLARGLFFDGSGQLVASVVQESLMRTRRP